MSWLSWAEDKAKDAADKAGDVIDAVVPDPIRNIVSQAPSIVNPATRIPALLNIASNLGGRIPLPGAQQGANLINWAANGPPSLTNTPQQLLQDISRGVVNQSANAIRNPAQVAGSVRSGATNIVQNPKQSLLQGVSAVANAADKPRQAVVTDMGDQAYYMATHNGAKPNHGVSSDPYVLLGNILPDSFLTKWANDEENWAQIKYVYEHGYDSNKDGRPDFQGGRAVWELYASQIGGVTKTLADIAFDPLNAIPGVGAFGKGVERLGKVEQIATDGARGAGIADLGSMVAKTAGAIDRAGNLPFEVAGKVLSPVTRPLGNAIGESAVGRGAARLGGGVKDALGLRESQGSIERGVEENVTDVLGRTPNLVSETEIPDWAVSVTPTGRFEAVSNQEIRNFGGSYIVDPDGHPVPGTARIGAGANKQNQRVSKGYNADGGAKPQGRANAPGVATGSVDAVPGPVPVEPDVPPTIQQEVAQPYADRIAALEEAVKDAQNLSGIQGTRQAEFSTDRETLQSMLDDLRAGKPSDLAPDASVERIGTLHDEIDSIDAQIDIERSRVNVNEPNLIGQTSKNSRLYRLTQLRRMRIAELRELEYRTGQVEFLPSSSTTTQEVPNPEFRPGPKAVVGEGGLVPTVGPNPSTAPAYYLQNPAARSASIGEGRVSGLAPRNADDGFLIQNMVEQQRAVNPDRAAEYDRIIGVDPQTGQARPGSWSHRFDEEQKSISAASFPTFAEKTARGKLAAIEHTIGPQLDAFRSAFGEGMSPSMRKSASRPINELVDELMTSTAIDKPLADLMDRAVYSAKDVDAKGALRALNSYGKQSGNKWLTQGGEIYNRLLEARNTFRRQLKTDLKPTPTAQTLLSTASDPATVMPVTPTGRITPPAFLPPETPQAVLKRMGDDMRIDPEDVDFLSKVQGNMDKPLVDEYYDRLMGGMTEDQAKADILAKLYPSGNKETVRPGKYKTTMNKLGKVNVFARQNMQHNIANAIPGNLGDRLGNRMILFAEGKYGALMKSFDPRAYFHALGSPTKIKDYLSKETDPLLAGFGRDLPATVVPERTLSSLESKMGHAADELLIAKATKNKGKAAQIAGGTIFGNQRVADTRGAMETVERSMLASNEIREMLPDKILDFQNQLRAANLPAGDTLRAIQERATAMRAPADFLKGKKPRTLSSFSAEDVMAVTGNKQLADSWSRAVNSMYKQAGNEARRVFFAGAKRYGIDDKLGQVFFFHFWASRALAQQAKAMARSPRVLSAYYRMVNGAMHEADRNNYPLTFRGLMHYWGDTDAGFYGLWNPLGVLVPAMMFSDLATIVDDPDSTAMERWYNRFSSAIPVAPLVTAAAAALGITDDTPSLTGTTRIQNIATDVMNYAQANGIDLTHGGVIADPVATVTQAVLQRVNQSANFITKGSVGTYEPYNARSGKIDTIREVLINNMEEELGPKEQWTPEAWQRFQVAATSLSVGGGTNEDAKEAYRDYASAALLNRGLGSLMPQGSVLRYGPREQARNADTPAAKNERDLATVSPELLPIEAGQQYLGGDNIGTERQRSLWEDWNNIAYGVMDFDASRDQQTLQVNGQTLTVRALKAMTEDERMALADAFIAGVGGTQELTQFKDLRNAYIDSNPSLGNYREWQGKVRDYETGVMGFRQWASSVSPAFKQAEQSTRLYYADEYGLAGAALESQLDDWATSPRAYAAFTGTPETVYDQSGGGADQATQAAFAMAGTSGSGSGSGGKSSSIASRIRNGIDSYQERLAEYEAAGGPATQAPGLFGVGQEQMYGSIPQPSDEVQRFMAWSQRQPPGTDISPEAYEAMITSKK
jgi:hypothetical protein